MKWFRFLAAGYTVSSFGSYLNMIAIGLYAYLVTGSALHTGLFMALRVGAGFLAGLASGPLTARFPRKRVMIAADLTQATAMLSLAVTPVDSAQTLLYAVAVSTGACQTLTMVSLRSGVPSIVGQEERVKANALLVTSRATAMVAGFAGAGILVDSAGFAVVFSVNAAAFAISAANLSWLPVLREIPALAAHKASERRGHSSLSAAGAVFAAAPMLLALVLVRAGDAIGSSSHIVGLPIYAATMNPDDPARFLSQFWTGWAVGMVLTQQVVMRVATRNGHVPGERSFAAGTVVMSLLFVASFTGVTSWSLVAVALLAGLADGYSETAYVSRLQTVDEGRRTAMFGAVAMIEQSSLGTGMVVSAMLLSALPPSVVVTVLHGFGVASGLSLLVYATVRRARAPRPAEATSGVRS
ncbi:MAG: MFS transporter [Stackebrandtia sp.]